MKNKEKLLSEIKEIKIKEQLRNIIGVIATNNNGLVVATRAESENSLHIQFNSETKAIAIAVMAGKNGDLVEINLLIHNLASHLARIGIAAQDFHRNMFRDVLCLYLRDKLYDEHNENPVAVGIAIIQNQISTCPKTHVRQAHLSITLIDSFGNYKEASFPEDNFAVFGCSDPKKEELALNKLEPKEAKDKAKKPFDELSTSELRNLIRSALAGMPGETVFVSWDFEKE